MKIHRLEDLTPEIIARLRTEPLTPEEEREAYRLARESFTAADLAEYLDEVPTTSFREMVEEMELLKRQYEAGEIN
jgi:hypothetical protein